MKKGRSEIEELARKIQALADENQELRVENRKLRERKLRIDSNAGHPMGTFFPAKSPAFTIVILSMSSRSRIA